MRRILVLGEHHLIAQRLFKQLQACSNVQVSMLTTSQLHDHQKLPQILAPFDTWASFLGPHDVDLAFEALFTASDVSQPPLKQILMLSTAGIDHEVIHGQLKYAGINNLKEYFNEQRYAIKLIDESEIPYTILRPVNITTEQSSSPLQIIEEGHLVPVGSVSVDNIVKLSEKILLQPAYLNQSIALVEKRGK